MGVPFFAAITPGFSPEEDVKLYWKEDFKKLKKMPILLAVQAYKISQNESKSNSKNIDVIPHEIAMLEVVSSIKSITGKAIANVIIEDFDKRIQKDSRMYYLEFSESKIFMDNEMLTSLLQASFESNETEKAFEKLESNFKINFDHEKRRIIKYLDEVI